MPKAELAVLEGCGHFSYLDDPDRVAALVAGLMARDTGPDR
jgi:pimeloyl-ACP methyl ester carboxylesterase